MGRPSAAIAGGASSSMQSKATRSIGLIDNPPAELRQTSGWSGPATSPARSSGRDRMRAEAPYGQCMARMTITLGRRPVGIADLVAIARDGAKVALGSAALGRLKRSRAVVDTLAAGAKPIYGLNTGLGAGVDTRLSAAEMSDFQARVLIA